MAFYRKGPHSAPAHIEPTPALPGDSVAPRVAICQSSRALLDESNIQAHIIHLSASTHATAAAAHPLRSAIAPQVGWLIAVIIMKVSNYGENIVAQTSLASRILTENAVRTVTAGIQ